MPASTHPRARRGASALVCAALALAGARPACAADAPKDPLERLNRATFKFNDAFDRALARPVAKAYRAVVPAKARQVVSNFVANLGYPTVVVNDALQGKLKDAGSDSLRFLTNTVVGLGGLFDPATRLGLAIHDEDFGQTLGVWGIGPGPYLVLPFLGPSDVRDAPSKIVNHYTSGDYYLRYASSDALSSNSAQYAVYGLRALDTRTELLSTDEALQQSFDRYAVVRNAFVARREYLVRDGNVPDETYDEPVDDAPAAKPVDQATPRDAPEQPKPQAEAGATAPLAAAPESSALLQP